MSFALPTGAEELLNFRLARLLASSGAEVMRLCEGRYGITRQEWRLIALLAEHGKMSPSRLAERSYLDRARVSRAITALTSRRLLVRTSSPADRRQALVELTPRGRAVYDELFPRSVALQNRMLAALEPGQLAALDEALARLTEVAERLRREEPPAAKADRRHGGSRRVEAGDATVSGRL